MTAKRRGGVRMLLVRVAAGYVVFNLAMPTVVTIVSPVEIEVTVVDAAGGAPIAGASVAIAHAATAHVVQAVVTDRSGKAVLRTTLAAAVQWVWPSVGSVSLRGLAIDVQAVGARPASVPLGEALPAVAYADPRGRIDVRLERE